MTIFRNKSSKFPDIRKHLHQHFKNIDDKFPRYYIHGTKCNRVISLTIQSAFPLGGYWSFRPRKNNKKHVLFILIEKTIFPKKSTFIINRRSTQNHQYSIVRYPYLKCEALLIVSVRINEQVARVNTSQRITLYTRNK